MLTLNDEQERALREWWLVAEENIVNKTGWSDTRVGYTLGKVFESLRPVMGAGRIKFLWFKDGKDIVSPSGQRFRVSGGGVEAIVQALNEAKR